MKPFEPIRPELLSLSKEQFSTLVPYFWIFGGILCSLLINILRLFNSKWPVFLITILACFLGMKSSYDLMDHTSITFFNGMFISDFYSHFFNILFLLTALVTTLVSFRYLDTEKIHYSEYFILILFSVLGMMLLTSSLDLIVTFIALELMSLSLYPLAGFRRSDRKCNEASLKYFILGTTASTIFLYGVAFIYGCSGSTQPKLVLDAIQNHPTAATSLFALGMILVFLGFLFKIAASPFHMWAPDVYEGAPIPITGFMATGLKVAAFATLIRFIVLIGLKQETFKFILNPIYSLLWSSALTTVAIGNFVALMQTNLKRMIAYSSIAHTGYLLIGILVGIKTESGYAPVIFYLFVYSFVNLGIFSILTLLKGRNDTELNLHDLSGISKHHPYLAFSLTILLLSLAGIPPLAGFFSKYLLFYSALQAGEGCLVFIAVLCSTISVYYYLRIIVVMYFQNWQGSPKIIRVPLWSGIALIILVFLTFQLGLFPEWLMNMAKKAALSL